MIYELKCEGCDKHIGWLESFDPAADPDAYCDECAVAKGAYESIEQVKAKEY